MVLALFYVVLPVSGVAVVALGPLLITVLLLMCSIKRIWYYTGGMSGAEE
jgi:hypothetical protein